MPKIDQYHVTAAKMRLLLQGPPGSCKTTLACHFPKPWIIDLDLNLAGPLAWLKAKGLPLPVGFDVVDHDDSDKEVLPINQYQRLNAILQRLQADPEVETIVIDTATRLSTILMEETKRLQPNVKDGRQLFGFYFQYGMQLFDTLSRMRKHIVLNAHEQKVTDTAGNLVNYEVAWPGKMAEIMSGFFTDNWRSELVAVPRGLQTNYKLMVQTMPKPYFQLKNSLQLPANFEFSWKTVEEALQKTIGGFVK